MEAFSCPNSQEYFKIMVLKYGGIYAKRGNKFRAEEERFSCEGMTPYRKVAQGGRVFRAKGLKVEEFSGQIGERWKTGRGNSSKRGIPVGAEGEACY